jgi:3-oxoacyl-[acyl-carrier protein] reductase
MARFTENVAVVTGASKRIGAGVAKRLATEDASVVVNYASRAAGANRIVDGTVRAGGQAVAIGASVTNEADVTRLFEQVRKAFGRVDVLVNNAGIYALAPIEGVSVSESNRHFDTNVLGLLLATRASLPLFPAAWGSVVNISSVVSTLAPAASAIYVGTKGAVDSITKSLAKEFAPRKIGSTASTRVSSSPKGRRTAGLAASSRYGRWSAARSDAPANPRTSRPRSHFLPRTTRAGPPASHCASPAAWGCKTLPRTAHASAS